MLRTECLGGHRNLMVVGLLTLSTLILDPPGSTLLIIDLPQVDTVDWPPRINTVDHWSVPGQHCWLPPQDQQCWLLIHPRSTLLIVDLPQVNTVDWPPRINSVDHWSTPGQHCWSLIHPQVNTVDCPPQDQQCWSLICPGSTLLIIDPPQVNTVDCPPRINSVDHWSALGQHCWLLIHPRSTLLITPPGSTVLIVDLPEVDTVDHWSAPGRHCRSIPPTDFNFVIFNILMIQSSMPIVISQTFKSQKDTYKTITKITSCSWSTYDILK